MTRVGAGHGEAVTTGLRRPRSWGWAVRGLLARSPSLEYTLARCCPVGPAFQDAALEGAWGCAPPVGADREVCAEPAGGTFPRQREGEAGGQRPLRGGRRGVKKQRKATNERASGGGGTARPTRLPAKPYKLMERLYWAPHVYQAGVLNTRSLPSRPCSRSSLCGRERPAGPTLPGWQWGQEPPGPGPAHSLWGGCVPSATFPNSAPRPEP